MFKLRSYPLLLVACVVAALFFVRPAAAQIELECQEPAIEAPTPSYYVGLGNAYFSQIDYTEAIAAYTCALDVDSNYVPAYVRRGYAYTIQGNDERALEDFNRALEIDENFTEAYTNRGVLYMSQGNFGLAIGDFTLVLALDPENVAALNNRGIAYAAEGSFDLAVADLEQALVLDPEYAPAHAALGATYTALATRQYQTYRQLSAEGELELPRRQPVEIIRAVDEDGVIREFAVWLNFLEPSR